VLAAMVLSGSSLRDLSLGMPRLPQVLVNVGLGDAVASEIMQNVQVNDTVADAEATLGNSGRVLLRPSGTEPLIRVMVEGTEAAQVTDLANAIADAVRAVAAS